MLILHKEISLSFLLFLQKEKLHKTKIRILENLPKFLLEN